jgi:Tfp pilus assembly protein PilF
MEKDTAAAFQYLKQAETFDAKRPEIFHLRSLAYLSRNDLDNALSQMQMAYQLAPKDPGINSSYGKLLMDKGQFNLAEQKLLFAAINPEFADAYKARTSLGILYYRQGELSKATTQFEAAIAENPTASCIAMYYLGHVQMKRGDVLNAEVMYQKATLKTCAGFVEAHYALGLALERNQKTDQARRKFLEVRQNFPESAIAKKALERLRHLQ